MSTATVIMFNKTAAKLYCSWYGVDYTTLYDMIGENPSLIQQIERFEAQLRKNKPSLLEESDGNGRGQADIHAKGRYYNKTVQGSFRKVHVVRQ